MRYRPGYYLPPACSLPPARPEVLPMNNVRLKTAIFLVLEELAMARQQSDLGHQAWIEADIEEEGIAIQCAGIDVDADEILLLRRILDIAKENRAATVYLAVRNEDTEYDVVHRQVMALGSVLMTIEAREAGESFTYKGGIFTLAYCDTRKQICELHFEPQIYRILCA